MKNLIYIFLLALPHYLMGQNIRYNIITGPSLSWMSANFNKIHSGGAKLAFKFQAQAEYWITDRYAITGGLGITLGPGGDMEYEKGVDLWKAAKLSDPKYHAIPENANLGYKMNYIDIPFGFKLRTIEIGKYRFFLHAPEFAISIRTKARGTIDASGLEATEDEDIRDVISFLSLFYGIGAGTEFKVSNDVTLNAGLRFFQSFTDLTDDGGRYDDGTKEDSKGILSSLDFRIGISF
jgi:hypothetical protein